MIALVLSLSLALATDPVAPADGTGAAANAVAEAEPAGPDRSGAPAVVPAELLPLPEAEVIPLSESATLRLVSVPGLRKVSVTVYQHKGGVDFEGHVDTVHLAQGWLQDVAAGDRSADEVAVYEDYWDADVWTTAGGLLRAESHVDVPREDLERGLELLADVLRAPAYPGRDVKQWRVERARYLTQEAPNSPSAIAGSLLDHGWYAPDHPYGVRPDLDAVRGLKRKALAARHAAIRDTAPITVLVVGDLDAEAARAAFAPVVAGMGQPGAESDPPAYNPPAQARVLASDLSSSTQATVMLRLAAPLRDHPDRVAFSGAAWAYGGHFLSRINKNLREERGITYGARARYSPGETSATFDISVDVPAEHVETAITQIDHELDRIVAEGVTAEELSAWVLEEVGWWNQVLQTADSAGGFYQGRFEAEESVEQRRARIEASRAVTPDAVRSVAATWLGDAGRQWVVVGPKAAIEPQLASAGAPVEWVSPQDAVLGAFE